MIDKAKVTAAISEMTQNPDWKEVLKDAPGAANLRIALAFYASKNLDSMSQQEKDEYREFREMLEAQLNATELKYLTEAFGRMGVETAKSHYNDLFMKKPTEEQQKGQQEYDALMNGGGEAGQESNNGDSGQGANSETSESAGQDEENKI